MPRRTNEEPYSRESEEAVIGVIINEEGAPLPAAQQRLRPEDFYLPYTRALYTAICAMAAERLPINLCSVYSYVADSDLDTSATAASECTSTGATSASIDFHINQVAAYSTARAVRAFGLNWSDRACRKPTGDHVPAMMAELKALNNRSCSGRSPADLLQEHRAWLEKGDKACLETGLTHLDHLIKCLDDHLWVIAGRPKMGKTSFAVDLSYRIMANGYGRGLFYSLEMSAERILRKFHARLLDHKEYLRAVASHQIDALPNLYLDSLEAYAKLPIDIVDDQHDIEGICASIRHECQRNPEISHIAIDYIEMIRTRERVSGPVETINHCLQSLVALKKEIRRPIFLLAQLRRRGSDMNASSPPSMDELKGSGLLEQSADVILMLHHMTEVDSVKRLCGDIYKPICAEVVQRDGPSGNLKFRAYPKQSLFEEWPEGGLT